MYSDVLLKLNNCGNCNVFKCIYCSRFSVNCRMCLLWRCKNCTPFNKSKDILINSGNKLVAGYVSNFLVDYFSILDISQKFFNLDISNKVKEENVLYIYDESRLHEKNYSTILYEKEKEAKKKLTFNLKKKKADGMNNL